MKKNLYSAIILVVLFALILILTSGNDKDNSIKIGLITDLSGSAAYFGEKSLLGAEMVKSEFLKRGIEVEVISEDYQLEAGKAATAAQKLLNVDGVDLIYTDFNPGAISVASVLESNNQPFIYGAAIESPQAQVETAFKVYLDYREGCKQVANKFKERGLEKIGMLKVGLEFGELCAEGVKEVYGHDVIVEGYTLGDIDFRTQITKLKNQKVEAIMNVGFEGDTYNTLKNMDEMGIDLPYGTVADTITEKVIADFSEELKGGLAFGYEEIDESFKVKIEDFTGDVIEVAGPEYVATALAYTHLTQAVEVIIKCGDDNSCFVSEMGNKTTPNILGFQKFEDRIAINTLKIFEF